MAAEQGGHPSVQESGCRTMREYVYFLRARIVGLKESLCENYLGMCARDRQVGDSSPFDLIVVLGVENYEAARFGTREFAFDDFAVFMKGFLVLCQEVESGLDEGAGVM
jgi:hypothetical protein